MTKAGLILKAIVAENEAKRQAAADSPIDRIIQKIYAVEFPGRDYFESYMRYKWRMNHKPVPLREAL